MPRAVRATCVRMASCEGVGSSEVASAGDRVIHKPGEPTVRTLPLVG